MLAQGKYATENIMARTVASNRPGMNMNCMITAASKISGQ
jgi:hypothetical protein